MDKVKLHSKQKISKNTTNHFLSSSSKKENGSKRSRNTASSSPESIHSVDISWSDSEPSGTKKRRSVVIEDSDDEMDE